MIKRQIVTKIISELSGNSLKLVSCLGRISRDIYCFSRAGKRYHCFYQLGAMGSALPFALGLSMANQTINVLAIEGDGSILMNLGGLVTFKRYNPGNLSLIILDNRQYETTGGQPSQPENFEIYQVAMAIGLTTQLVEYEEQLEIMCNLLIRGSIPNVVVIKTEPDQVSPRIVESPISIAANFKNHLK
ncbi:thiamine pyrophosphate-dependent enzyme [Puia dinghuensis]|uniref:thiamine pyrophosphate-dependent enzyme n=1 Tax=Puia dinghuensis TaxID=1792502 RepID=UPI001668A723|nr:thiamine pyrophosphate-dependent enzyme [Puia dinghuensis]